MTATANWAAKVRLVALFRNLWPAEIGTAAIIGALAYAYLQARAAGQLGAEAALLLAVAGAGLVAVGSSVSRWANLRSLAAAAVGVAVASLPAGGHFAEAFWQSSLLVFVFGASRAVWAIRSQQRAAQERAAAAVTEERARIARDLHDVIAHSLGVVIFQVQAADRVMDADPAKAHSVLQSAAVIGRDALDEMHRMVGVMRGGNADRAAQPTLADLYDLIEQSRQAGLAIELHVEGEMGRTDVPPGVELAAYRIVQEALTNAARHSVGGNAEVYLRHKQDGIEIEVVSSGGSSRPAAGGGFGIAGMRERAAMYEGTLEAGPRAEGGFRVAARLPARRT
jgi:signal transduction histidine kinase